MVNIIFLEIIFFHQLLLNGIAFKKSILKFIRPSSNSIFNGCSSNGIKLNTRLRLGHRDTKYLSVFSPNAGKYRPE